MPCNKHRCPLDNCKASFRLSIYHIHIDIPYYSKSRRKPTITLLWGTTDGFEVEWQFSLDQSVTLHTTEIPL